MTKFKITNFVSHVHSFMDSLHLIDPTKSNLVAVSGGLDSIALLYILHKIFKKKVRVLHFNHGTRAENKKEQELVINHCQFLGVEVDIITFTLDIKQKNFEATARNQRAHIYKQYIHKNYHVYTAHHLDDSFEWSMIQSFKQSSLYSTLGIPVFNKGLVRPFMCVSKKQIHSYASALGLLWAEDSSNENMRFERNFFRAQLTGTINQRYPQYLRHYVARQNALALRLKVHRNLFLNDGDLKEKMKRPEEVREASGAVVLSSLDFSFHKEQIKEWIHLFSKNHRGEIDRELDKLIAAHKKIAENPREIKMKGPLAFSGGVKIYILKDHLLITNDFQRDFYFKYDELLLQFLIKYPSVEFGAKSLTDKPAITLFPYLSLLSSQDRSKSSKLIHPLLPKSTAWLRQKQVPYTFSPLIVKKGKQKLIHNAVILDSSLLGL